MTDITNQRTIGSPIEMKGVGLHTGRKCKTVIHPAAENAGIHFIRVDLPGKPVFKAHVDNVVDVIRGTTLGQGEAKVYTIEHVLSALNGLEIDNVNIEMDDSEPPVLDGSSKGFVDAILKSGIKDQSAPKSFFTVNSPIEYVSNQTVVRLEPSDHFEIEAEIDYDHPLLKNQKLTFKRGDDYLKLIAPARTYCFDYEIEALKKNGLAKGGSLDNAIVVGPTGIYNPGAALRFPDEFVRHKILDLMGDLMLLGQPLKGKVIAKRCGHGHNIKFLKQVLQQHPASSSASLG